MADSSATAATRSREARPDVSNQSLAQKNHLISELANAVDNQFNNTMMAITSYAELELKKAPPSQKRSWEQVIQNAGRATCLIQKLLAISRSHASSPQLVQMNDVVADITSLFQQLVGEQIAVNFRLQPGLPHVKTDPLEFEQLLCWIAIHARTTILAPAHVTLATTSLDLAAEPGKTQQSYVMLSLCDSQQNRSSMPEHADRRVAVQDGAGFELETINCIVEGMGGFVRTSEQGAIDISVYLPAVEGEIANDSEIREKTLSGSKTILVVEDDDAVRIPAAELLKMEGFKVLQAKTGPEAINMAMQKRVSLDLLITDIMMPHMTGPDVARALLGMHPELKVLYMSGDPSAAGASGEGLQNDLLQKPFRLDKLNEKIRTLLGE